MRNHLVALAQNSTEVVTDVLGQSNLRDLEIIQQGGTILQHSAPVPYASLFLIDDKANFINALRYAQQEYTKFKNKFLSLAELGSKVAGWSPTQATDAILTKLNDDALQVVEQILPYFQPSFNLTLLFNTSPSSSLVDGFF